MRLGSTVAAFALPACAGLAAVGCSGRGRGANAAPSAAPGPCGAAGGALPDLDALAVRYDGDDGVRPATVQITTSDVAGLAAVDAVDDASGAEVQVHFAEGDFGAGDGAPNASMRQRGRGARAASQRSYRIELWGSSALWHGQRVIDLSEHPSERARVRQKLSFDLFRSVPHFATLDTRFVRLFVNGEDRGLYTSIENPDERYLAAHALPPGTVYAPVLFDFAPIPDDAWQDRRKLDSIIEAETAPAPDKLRAMIAAVNDPSMTIDDVVARYFNRQNYETWLAIDELVGNAGQGPPGYLLYSPDGCDGWYFLPWDDDAGLAAYSSSALHARFLREPANAAEVESVRESLGRLYHDMTIR
jgi:spore coat protein H